MSPTKRNSTETPLMRFRMKDPILDSQILDSHASSSGFRHEHVCDHEPGPFVDMFHLDDSQLAKQKHLKQFPHGDCHDKKPVAYGHQMRPATHLHSGRGNMSSIALKLTTLFVRQIAKPIANTIKSEAKNHQGFKVTCVRVAQYFHFLDERLKTSLMGSKARQIRPLNEAKAIQNGAEILSETFIFSVAAGALLYESNRQRVKEKNRKEGMESDVRRMEEEIAELREVVKLIGGDKLVKAVETKNDNPELVMPVSKGQPPNLVGEIKREKQVLREQELKDSDSADK
ncbi:hypothetical protein OGAPHI_001865 [Ogataea philodendri]|uniref:OPA3-like protein n=1 Tax=Ogataea philodendri TaxID=1378263 RepID=A0A9P8PAD8_9ASCO|nr:uncharacterized protein OGAPHI_001865 [Ogataea philodendri]KAH3668111.1 hypothetical protein OGAPHI_001865 [Ogataea philodendri]